MMLTGGIELADGKNRLFPGGLAAAVGVLVASGAAGLAATGGLPAAGQLAM